MMGYFCDLVFGIIMAFMVQFCMDVFYHPNVWITLLVTGVLLSCIASGIYSERRFAITKEKMSIGLWMLGIAVGQPLEWIIRFVFSESGLWRINRLELKGWDAWGEAVMNLVCKLILTIMIPVVSLIFLLIFTRIRKGKCSKKKGEQE